MVQQALLGGEQRALAVGVEGAALEHERRLVAAHAPGLGDGRRHLRVLVVGREVLAPAVEAEVHHRDLTLVVAHEDGAVVADPGVVERDGEEVDGGSPPARRYRAGRPPSRPSSSRASASCAGSTITVTGSNRAMPRATSAHSRRASSMSGPNRSSRHGHESSVRWCGVKRAGRRKPSARGVDVVAAAARSVRAWPASWGPPVVTPAAPGRRVSSCRREPSTTSPVGPRVRGGIEHRRLSRLTRTLNSTFVTLGVRSDVLVRDGHMLWSRHGPRWRASTGRSSALGRPSAAVARGGHDISRTHGQTYYPRHDGGARREG